MNNTDFRSFGALLKACESAQRGSGDSREAAAFLVEREQQILALHRRLLSGGWQPGGFRTFVIREPKRRVISAAPFGDRVVHHAVCAQLEPMFDRRSSPISFACRKGRGTVAALRRARELARRFQWYLKLDVEHYFETLPHAGLLKRLSEVVEDAEAFAICERIVRFGAPGSQPGHGVPIGNLTSQHFSNDYLSQLDHHLMRSLRVPAALRYMDDILIFSDDPSELRACRAELQGWVGVRLGLRLKPSAERLAPVLSGVPFLGFRIWPSHIRLDGARRTRLARRLRTTLAALDRGSLCEHDAAACLQSVCAWSDLGGAVRFRQSVLARYEQTGARPIDEQAPTG